MYARSRHVVALGLAAFAAGGSGCAAATAGTPAGTAGIRAGIAGTAVVAPTCPVQRPGETCARPYLGTLIVYRGTQHRRVRQLRTDTHGRFHIDLAPGHYMISARRVGYRIVRNASVTVRPHHVTHVTVEFDAGIR